MTFLSIEWHLVIIWPLSYSVYHGLQWTCFTTQREHEVDHSSFYRSCFGLLHWNLTSRSQHNKGTLSNYSEWLTLFISKIRPENSICLTRQLHFPRSIIVCTEEDSPSLDTSTSGHVHSSNNRRLHSNNSLSHSSNNTRLHSNNNLEVLLYFYVKLTARSIMRSFMEPFSCYRIQLFFLSCFMYVALMIHLKIEFMSFNDTELLRSRYWR